MTRIYKTDDNDQILKKQPRGYPFTITEDYELGENEKAQVHKGVDITSRPAPNEPARLMDLKAGVYGVVVRAGGGDWGTISVQLRDGSVIQYLHTTASHVKVGDVVAPDTLLGACPNICSCSRMAAGFCWALAFSASAQPCARTIPLNLPRRCRSGADLQKIVGQAYQLPLGRHFLRPRNRNLRIPRADLIMPNTGSTICLRTA